MTKLTHDTEINLAGVMGYPITHSRSPLMHNTLMQENGVRGSYIPIEIKSGQLGPALESLPRLGFKGVNLTMPLKQEAIATIDELDPAAKLIGAVSCVVVRKDDSLLGINNDWIGFKDNLTTNIRLEITHQNSTGVRGWWWWIGCRLRARTGGNTQDYLDQSDTRTGRKNRRYFS